MSGHSISANSGAEKPTRKYSRSLCCFQSSSWNVEKIRFRTSLGDTSPALTGHIHVQSIVSDLKDSGSKSSRREWLCPGIMSATKRIMIRG